MTKHHQQKPIRILNGGLDDVKGDIILRGSVDPSSLTDLLVDEYQREALPVTGLSDMLEALKQGVIFPDIELGMRGHTIGEREGVYTLREPVYIVDGQQRVNAAIHFLRTNPDKTIRLGAMIHFGTSKEWERERFLVTNTGRLRISPNVILRNQRETSTSVQALYGLSTRDDRFVLKGRVSWNQRMTRGEFISALTMAKIAGRLLAHKAPGGRSNRTADLVPSLDRAVTIFGVNIFRDNIRTFFDLIDECWGIRRVQYKESAIYMRSTYLFVLAKVLCDHEDFWREDDGRRLFIDAPLRRKIALFAINDPEIIRLASSGGKAHEMLYMLMLGHINSGKRTKRLTARPGAIVSFDEGDNGGEEETGQDEASS